METMRGIAAEVAARHDISVDDLRGQSRAQRFTHPRQEAMWRMLQVRWADGTHRYSYPMIGQFFGGRDHTTALWGFRAHERRVATSKFDAGVDVTCYAEIDAGRVRA